MKLTVSSSVFLSHLQMAAKVIASKNNIPILECIMFELKEGKLSLTASDSETLIKSTFEVISSEGEGAFCVPARMLVDPIKEMSEQPITLDINETSREITVSYQAGHFNMISESANEYPQMTFSADAEPFEISLEDLASGINHTLFAVAQDDLRPIMTGVYLDITPDNITFVATDAHKLARLINPKYKGINSRSFILPKKPLSIIKNIFGKEEGMVKIAVGERNVRFEFSNFLFVCRLIEGRYPNYNAVIPTYNPNKAIADRESLIGALKRVSYFANSEVKLVRLQFSNDQIILSCQDKDFSIAAEEHFTCSYAGDPMTIGFKGFFLIDILNNIESNEVVIALSDPSRSGVITPIENKENEDLTMLLMPLTVADF